MYVCVNTLGNLLVRLLLHAFSPLLFFVFLSFTERYHISFVICMKCIGRCVSQVSKDILQNALNVTSVLNIC